MDHEDTRRLLERWHAGDAEALRALVEENLDWIEVRVRERLGQKLRRVGNTHDFVQEALLDFLRYGPRFRVESRARFRAILARVIENAIRDQEDYWFRAERRALSRELRLSSDSICVLSPGVRVPTPPDERAGRNEMEALLRLAIELSDPEDRKVIVLRDWKGLSFDEMAERLGVSTDAARKRYQRALPRLANLLERLRKGRLDSLDSNAGDGLEDSSPPR